MSAYSNLKEFESIYQNWDAWPKSAYDSEELWTQKQGKTSAAGTKKDFRVWAVG